MPEFDKIGVQDLYGGEQGELDGTFTRQSRIDPRNTVTLGKALQYIPVTMFGAKGDGTTDDTTAIQNAINYASSNEMKTVFFPAGRYRTTATIYLEYDATNNPNFNSGEFNNGAIRLLGEGSIHTWAFHGGAYYGSCIEGDADVGPVIQATSASSSTYVPNIQIEKLTVIGNNDSQVVKIQQSPLQTGLDHVYIGQNGTGDGLHLLDGSWFSYVRDTTITKTSGGNKYSGIGIYFSNPNGSGYGITTFENCNVKNWDTGIQVGEEAHGDGNSMYQITFRSCQAAVNNIGVLVASDVDGFRWEGGHAEGNETTGFLLRSGCSMIYINSFFWGNDTDITIGVNDVDQDKVSQVYLDRCKHLTNAETTAAIRIYESTNINKIIINQPNFYSGHSMDHAIELEDGRYYLITVIQPIISGVTQLCADSGNNDMSQHIQYLEQDRDFLWQQSDKAGVMTEPPFWFKNLGGSTEQPPVGFYQRDNDKAFFRLDVDYELTAGINPNITTLQGHTTSGAIISPRGPAANPQTHGWKWFGMAMVEVGTSVSSKLEVYMPLYQVDEYEA